jgi:hypothetical protein
MKANFRRNLKWIFLAWLILLVGIVLAVIFAPASKASAWAMAQHFVIEELNAPGSTDFGSAKQGDSLNPEDHVQSLGDDNFRATGFAYTQNQFGGHNKSEFTCELRYLGHGNWERTKISIHRIL